MAPFHLMVLVEGSVNVREVSKLREQAIRRPDRTAARNRLSWPFWAEKEWPLEAVRGHKAVDLRNTVGLTVFGHRLLERILDSAARGVRTNIRSVSRCVVE